MCQLTSFKFQYHFFMAESFLTLYSSNSWTMQNVIDTKRRLHWILQLIGCIAIFVGIGIEIKAKDDAKRSHFKSDHAITGKCESGALGSV